MNQTQQILQRLHETHRAFTKAAKAALEHAEDQLGVRGAVRRPKIQIIQETVADHFRQHVSCMTTKDRPAVMVEARSVAIAICRALTGYTQTEIGKCFGGRDHGTISNAVESVNNRVSTEPNFKKEYESLVLLCGEALDNIDMPIFNLKETSK